MRLTFQRSRCEPRDIPDLDRFVIAAADNPLPSRAGNSNHTPPPLRGPQVIDTPTAGQHLSTSSGTVATEAVVEDIPYGCMGWRF